MCEKCVEMANRIMAKSAGLMPNRLCEVERLEDDEVMFLFGKLMSYFDNPEVGNRIEVEQLKELNDAITTCCVITYSNEVAEQFTNEVDIDKIEGVEVLRNNKGKILGVAVKRQEGVDVAESASKVMDLLMKAGVAGGINPLSKEVVIDSLRKTSVDLIRKAKCKYGMDFAFEIEGSEPEDIFYQIMGVAQQWKEECDKKAGEIRAEQLGEMKEKIAKQSKLIWGF